MSENITTEQWELPKNPWPITIAVMIATFISILDSTVANVALPHMAGSFSATNEEAMWILTSYLIASGIILPSVDWFSKVFGRKTFLLACIAIFTASSVLCGLSTSLDQIVLARIIQGIGGGALMPISQAILLESFPKEKRNLAMAIFGLGILVAPIIGPLVGGWITDTYSWNWIFYINLPIGILAFVMCKMYIIDPPYARKQGFQKIDYIGFGLLIIWLTAQQVVLDKGQNADWFSADYICWLTGIAVCSVIGFFISQLVRKNTIVDLSVFKDKNYAVGTAILTMIMGVMYASMAIMPLFLQNLLGYTAFLSGYAVMPRGVGCLISIFIIGGLPKLDERILCILGCIMLSSGCLMLGQLNLEINIMNIVIPNLFFGLGMGFCMLPLTTLSLNTLNNEQMTNATGLQSLLKETGGAIGTSIVSTLLARFSQMHQFHLVKNLDNLNPNFQQSFSAMLGFFTQHTNSTIAHAKANYIMYTQLLKQSTLWSFIDSFRVFGVVCLFLIPLVFFMSKGKNPPNEDGAMMIH